MKKTLEKFIVTGGKQLQGTMTISGAKNVALKALVAACLTDEEVVIENVPRISDVFVMIDIIKDLGGSILLQDHTVTVKVETFRKEEISLESAARSRTTAMFMVPLLYRNSTALIANPGGCRLGARPIDRIIEGLQQMGAHIYYDRDDGYFHAKTPGFHGVTYRFEKNTHTGTETLLIAASVAKGKTTLENAAEEPEIDELIALLNKMGANIKRTNPRTIEIEGVPKLRGARTRIRPDRNEIVTMAIAGILTQGDIFIQDIDGVDIAEFIEKLSEIGGGVEEVSSGIRFFYRGKLAPTQIVTSPYPGFMTDWQAPWSVLMTKAQGASTIHEAVFENRFGYVPELKKMGAQIELFNPRVDNPVSFYNFNLSDDKPGNYHAIRIHGPTNLHNAVVTISDLRAGATLVLGALAAKGKSTIFGVEHLERGYEEFDKRLKSLGAEIKRESV